MNANSKTFQCQQCGGAASTVPGREYLQCNYCRSLIFTADNPLTIDRITPMGDQLDAACPACSQTLCTGEVEGCRVLYCGDCYGLLLKHEDFGTITRVRRGRREGCESVPVSPLNTAEYERKIDCPNCQSTMEVHPYYGPGNVIIDSCSNCHYIWLDHGELKTVVHAEGGREPEPLPMHVNANGDVTIIPPPQTTRAAEPRSAYQEHPLAAIADLLFGF